MDKVAKHIILAPFNADSLITYHQCKMDGIEVNAFFDKNVLLQGKEYDGIFISQIYYIENARVILSCKKKTAEEIKRECILIGFKENQIIFSCDYKTNISKYDAAKNVDLVKFLELLPTCSGLYGRGKIKKLCKLKELGATKPEFEVFLDEDIVVHNFVTYGKPRLFLQNVDLIVTTKCTLRCNYCSNGIPFFTQHDYIDSDRIIEDYNRLIELVDYISGLAIVGGEVFLYKDLHKVISAVLKNPQTENKVGEINLISNGTIVPNENVLNALSNQNVSVHISNYHGLSKKIPAMVYLFQKYNIKYEVNNIQSVDKL